MIKTSGTLRRVKVKTLWMKTAVNDFKPMLVDAVRNYLTSIKEDELELVTVHKSEQLRRRMNKNLKRYGTEVVCQKVLMRSSIQIQLNVCFTSVVYCPVA